MPHKYYKCIAIKEKKPPQESRESSNLPSTEQTPTLREFTQLERNRLARHFSMVEICWLMYHNNTNVVDFVDRILEAEARASPKKDSPKDGNNNFLQEHHQQETNNESDEETVPLRYCRTCDNFGRKEEMAKCRKCGHWYHTWCVEEPARKGAEDPNFRFWLCRECKPDPKLFPGYKFTYRSKAEIEADKHYEDTNSDEPDFGVPAP